MKKISYIILLISLGIISCNEWLHAPSDMEIDNERQFETEAGFRNALMGIYINMASADMYGKNMTWFAVDMLGQNYSNFMNVLSHIQEYNYNQKFVSEIVKSVWLSTYNTIANINNELKYLEKNRSVLHPLNHRLIKGELLGLRAYLHFDLLRLFGYGNWQSRKDIATRPTIPYVTVFSKNTTPQRSYEETFRMLLSDISEALELLKQDPITGNFPESHYAEVNTAGFYDKRDMRMNYYAVKALEARIHMWKGSDEDKHKALAAAREVVEHYPFKWITPRSINHSEQAQQDLTFSTEHVFSLNVHKIHSITANFLTEAQIDNFNTFKINEEQINETYEIEIGYDDDWNLVLQGPGLSDYRRIRLFKEASPGIFVPAKLRQCPNYNTAYANRMPMLRISEMFYIMAECMLSEKDTDLIKAVEYMNTVRSNRGIKEEFELPNTLSKEEIMNEILKEYRKEFVCEGQLFFFYKRLGMENIPNYKNIMDDKKYMLPYPDEEISTGNRVQ